MLRLIHAQSTQGGILVDDIDDQLPNKTVHRMGSTADPKAYVRDGYANVPKQPCYVPRTKQGNPLIAGYIDLNLTPRVTLSAAQGKIFKLQQAGYITSVLFQASDLAVPVVTNAEIDTPGAGDVTITGTGFLSLAPNDSIVVITGTGATTLTRNQIVVGGGTFTATSIVILAALVPGVAAGTTSVQVNADDQNSNTFALV
jgi:hypothetical protein